MTGTGILKAFDFSGKELWMRDIQKDYGRFGISVGIRLVPAAPRDSLFVQVLHGMKTDDSSYILRIGKANGRTIWRQERPTSRAASRRIRTRRPRSCGTATTSSWSSPAPMW